MYSNLKSEYYLNGNSKISDILKNKSEIANLINFKTENQFNINLLQPNGSNIYPGIYNKAKHDNVAKWLLRNEYLSNYEPLIIQPRVDDRRDLRQPNQQQQQQQDENERKQDEKDEPKEPRDEIINYNRIEPNRRAEFRTYITITNNMSLDNILALVAAEVEKTTRSGKTPAQTRQQDIEWVAETARADHNEDKIIHIKEGLVKLGFVQTELDEDSYTRRIVTTREKLYPFEKSAEIRIKKYV